MPSGMQRLHRSCTSIAESQRGDPIWGHPTRWLTKADDEDGWDSMKERECTCFHMIVREWEGIPYSSSHLRPISPAEKIVCIHHSPSSLLPTCSHQPTGWIICEPLNTSQSKVGWYHQRPASTVTTPGLFWCKGTHKVLVHMASGSPCVSVTSLSIRNHKGP